MNSDLKSIVISDSVNKRLFLMAESLAESHGSDSQLQELNNVLYIAYI